jgi:hypothetical protein
LYTRCGSFTTSGAFNALIVAGGYFSILPWCVDYLAVDADTCTDDAYYPIFTFIVNEVVVALPIFAS